MTVKFGGVCFEALTTSGAIDVAGEECNDYDKRLMAGLYELDLN